MASIAPLPVTVTAEITLNRPDVRNALNEEMMAELTAWAQSVPAMDRFASPSCRSRTGVLGGADLHWMSKMVGYSRDENVADAHASWPRCIRRSITCRCRSSAASRRGARRRRGLAAVCDVVIATDDAMFRIHRGHAGHRPSHDFAMRPWKIGLSAARALCLNGTRFPPRALEIGLIRERVGVAEIGEAVQRHIEQFEGPRHRHRRRQGGAARCLRPAPVRVMAMTVDAIANQRVSPTARKACGHFWKRNPAGPLGKATETGQEEVYDATRLIANRGEIAVRVIRACKAMGLQSVAAAQKPTRSASRGAADVAVHRPAGRVASYLNSRLILETARRTGADAIHPGYGFLSENAEFAGACAAAGVTFVGPPAAVIERMGSKTAARKTVSAAGVPVVPGAVPVSQKDADIEAAVRTVGFPALIKASAGGGGKGMRLATGPEHLLDAIAAARRESERAFGDGTLAVERSLRRPATSSADSGGSAAPPHSSSAMLAAAAPSKVIEKRRRGSGAGGPRPDHAGGRRCRARWAQSAQARSSSCSRAGATTRSFLSRNEHAPAG